MWPAGRLPYSQTVGQVTAGMSQEEVQIGVVLFLALWVTRAVKLLTQLLICSCRSCKST